ncbi:MAG: hypothetical protein JNK72_03395 [Myxococcales bacterium]|nr:hypothetical protein [Myxococcales bacterium]
MGGEMVCGGQCANLSVDVNNCGGCGRRCCAGLTCSGGTCTAGCAAGTTFCIPESTGTLTCFGGICTNLATDPQHCGRCNTACAAGARCVQGACTSRTPDGSFIPVPPRSAGEVEVVAANLGGVQGLLLRPDGRSALVSATGLGVIWLVDWSVTPTRATRWAENLTGPSQLTYAPSGDVVVAEREGNRVTRIAVNPDGSAGQRTPFAASFTGPWGVVYDPTGRLLVSNEFGDSVDRIDAGGAVTRAIVPRFGGPLELRFDPGGRLYVGDYGNPLTSGTRVFVYNPDLSLLRTLTGVSGPIGMALDTSGNVYVANYTTNNVVRVTPTNAATPYVTGLTGPHAIAFDASGSLYVNDYGTGRLLRFPARY